MLHRAMANATMKAHEHVCQLDRSGCVPRALSHKMQASANTLLCEYEQQGDFSRAIAERASDVFGPISRHRITQVVPGIRCASRARVGCGITRVMCHGLCTCDMDEYDQLCRLGCVHQPDRLRHYIQCPIPMRPLAILHDLLKQTACRGAQHCILVLGLTDAFVCAHSHHRHNRNDPTNFEGCVQGRIRLQSALRPAHAHALQSIRVGRRDENV